MADRNEIAQLHEAPGNWPEALTPAHNPALGFESYRFFRGDATARAEQKKAFIAGDLPNPTFDYPQFQPDVLDDVVDHLAAALEATEAVDDPVLKDAAQETATVRMVAAFYVRSLAEITHLAANGLTTTELAAHMRHTQQLNETLYGTPDLGPMVRAEAWAQIDAKELAPKAAQLKAELDTVGSQIQLPRSSEQRLPEIPSALLNRLAAQLQADYADVTELANTYFAGTIAHRPEGQQVFTPADLAYLFEQTHAARDPQNASNFRVVIDPNGKSLDWDRANGTMLVGANRQAINGADTAAAKVISFYEGNITRSLRGAQSDVPLIGAGLVTADLPNEQSSNLPFDQGYSALIEKALRTSDDEEAPGWTVTDLEKYLAVDLAYQGHSFREVYEILWRTRVLLKVKPGADPTDKTIAAAKSNAYNSVERAFAGTPTDLPRQTDDGEFVILTSNQSLSYLTGKLDAVSFFQMYGNDPQMMALVKAGKINPMHPTHRAVAARAHGIDPTTVWAA